MKAVNDNLTDRSNEEKGVSFHLDWLAIRLDKIDCFNRIIELISQ
jgi:hypothetical protein